MRRFVSQLFLVLGIVSAPFAAHAAITGSDRCPCGPDCPCGADCHCPNCAH
jgi:hypothetical protein